MRNSLKDYTACILFKAFSLLFRLLPVGFVFFIGRRLGDAVYFLDSKHRIRARANIRKALSGKLTPRQIKKTSHEFYCELGQSMMEVFLTPKIDKAYLAKYVTIEGLDNIYNGLKRGKGVILMVVHEGSWELSNIVSSLQGYPFNVIVADQRMPRFNRILNGYRRQKGAKIIERDRLQDVIKILKNGEAVAITIDQGGSDGMHVKFFGRDASMSTGAIKLALKYDAAMLPVFFSRIKGPYAKITINAPMELKRTPDAARDIEVNLQEAVKIFEDFVSREPKEYYWTYKIWKHGLERDILVFWDGRAGHLRQAQEAAKLLSENLAARNIRTIIRETEINPLTAMKGELMKLAPDFIISCGSSAAKINYLLSRNNQAKSVVIMKPGLMSLRKFDLAIIPRHDRPPERKNVVVTDGAINLINEEYLKEQSAKLNLKPGNYIGLLLGGDSKKFRLGEEAVRKVITQVKEAAKAAGAGILVSTSRRTSPAVDSLVKNELKNYPACKLTVIANENNIPEAVGGILGLSSVVVISPESISMVSEASSSGKHVAVFTEEGLSAKHRAFLKYFSDKKYIHLVDAQNLAQKISGLFAEEHKPVVLDDRHKVKEALNRII